MSKLKNLLLVVCTLAFLAISTALPVTDNGVNNQNMSQGTVIALLIAGGIPSLALAFESGLFNCPVSPNWTRVRN